MSLYVQETYVNVDKGARFGETEVYETFAESVGRLFREMQKEYGRCIGKVYVDRPDGPSKPIGWVFQKRMQYEDSPDYYTREVWVTVHTAPPTKTVTHHYHEL